MRRPCFSMTRGRWASARLRPPPTRGMPLASRCPSISVKASRPKSPTWLLATDTTSRWRLSTGSTRGWARKVQGLTSARPPRAITHSRLPMRTSACRKRSATCANGSRPEAMTRPGPSASITSPTKARRTDGPASAMDAAEVTGGRPRSDGAAVDQPAPQHRRVGVLPAGERGHLAAQGPGWRAAQLLHQWLLLGLEVEHLRGHVFDAAAFACLAPHDGAKGEALPHDVLPGQKRLFGGRGVEVPALAGVADLAVQVLGDGVGCAAERERPEGRSSDPAQPAAQVCEGRAHA